MDVGIDDELFCIDNTLYIPPCKMARYQWCYRPAIVYKKATLSYYHTLTLTTITQYLDRKGALPTASTWVVNITADLSGLLNNHLLTCADD